MNSQNIGEVVSRMKISTHNIGLEKIWCYSKPISSVYWERKCHWI